MPADRSTKEPPSDRSPPASRAPGVGEPKELTTPEDREREAARRRGEARERERAVGQRPTRSAPASRERGDIAMSAFAALAENVRDYAIFLMDRDGLITLWGEGARLMKWWTKEQAEGAHLRLLYMAGGSEDGTAEEHLRLAAERGEYSGEGQRLRSDGSAFWAGVTVTTLRDNKGAVIGFTKVTRDLTARRAAEALLLLTAEAAEAARATAVSASAAKSGFLATMSHEIRTPLNAILGYHELLDIEVDGPLTPVQRRHLARASASSHHLLGLITEVLDFSRIEAEHMTVGRVAFKMGDAVAAALGLVAPQARTRGLEIVDAVSGSAAGLSAWGDEPRVRQILVNLLSNAIKFTEARDGASGRIIISVGAAAQPSPDARLAGDGPWIYARVEDTGPGVPIDRLEMIFEPFVQADMTLTREHGGTGLGLAISRRLARLMGGDVTVRSDVGVGSVFLLWLPAAPVESLHAGSLEVRGHAAVALAPIGSLREVANAVLAELERVLSAYVARLRSDPATPSAHTMAEAQIEDHLASFLADLAGTLATLDVPAGVDSDATRDGMAIQRVLAERHGAQRARLGWAEAEVRREFGVLKEELAAAVRRREASQLRGLTPKTRRDEADHALELLDQFLAVAERLSVQSYRRAARGDGARS